MSHNPLDPTRIDIPDRRGFLGGLAGLLGALAFTPEALGQSLLVRNFSLDPSAPWPTITAVTSVTSYHSYTFNRPSGPAYDGWALGYTSVRPGTTRTWTYTSEAWSHTHSYSYTDTYFGSQTLTVYATHWPSYPSYGASRTTLIGRNGSFSVWESYTPSGPMTGEEYTTRTATYSTTTWWSWGGGGGNAMVPEVAEPEPCSSLGTLDLPHDILDAHTRHGSRYRLTLGGE